MNPKKYLRPNVLIIIAVAFQFALSLKFLNAQEKNYHLVQTITIGDETSYQKDDILLKPTIIARSEKGDIFVADIALLAIKSFNRFGNYMTTFGQKGQGPGEFQDITAMTVNKKNEVVVVDYLNGKFIVYSCNGIFHDTHRLNVTKVRWPRRICCTPEGGYILLAKSEASEFLFHYYDQNFKYIKSFGKLPVVEKENGTFEKILAESFPGEIAINEKGTLYYVPGLYNGKIYLYKNFKLINILEAREKLGRSYIYKYLKKFVPGPPPPEYQITMSIGGNGMYYARRNLVSGGINFLDNGLLAHLLIRLTKTGYELGIELFEKDGAFHSYQKFKAKQISAYTWIASAGRWYFIDIDDFPIIKEYRLKIEDNK